MTGIISTFIKCLHFKKAIKKKPKNNSFLVFLSHDVKFIVQILKLFAWQEVTIVLVSEKDNSIFCLIIWIIFKNKLSCMFPPEYVSCPGVDDINTFCVSIKSWRKRIYPKPSNNMIFKWGLHIISVGFRTYLSWTQDKFLTIYI